MNSEQVGPPPTSGGEGCGRCSGANDSAGSECECERRIGASRAWPGRYHCGDGAGRDQETKEYQQQVKHEKGQEEEEEQEEAEAEGEGEYDDDDWL